MLGNYWSLWADRKLIILNCLILILINGRKVNQGICELQAGFSMTLNNAQAEDRFNYMVSIYLQYG